MAQIHVTIIDCADIRSFECLLPDKVEISRVAVRLADMLRLPTIGWDGRPLTYGLIAKGGLLLDPSGTLGSLNLPSPLVARLVPEIAAGADEVEEVTPRQPDADVADDDDFEVVVGEETALLHDLGLDVRPDVRIDAEIHRQIEDFAAANRNKECAGLLLGTVESESKGRIIHVTAIVPAESAIGTRASVSISLEAWEMMLKARDLDFGELRILGWFHTHAGWGVFMSESDVFIHRHFFPHPNMVAYVLDPTTGRDGFFYWHDGKLGICPSYGLVGSASGQDHHHGHDSQRDKRKHTPDPKKRIDPRNVTIALLALLVIYLIVLGSPLHFRKRIRTTPAPGSTPIVVATEQTTTGDSFYTIGKHDNPWSICNRVYRDGGLAMPLMRYNGLSNVSGLHVGQKIKLPPKDKLKRLAKP